MALLVEYDPGVGQCLVCDDAGLCLGLLLLGLGGGEALGSLVLCHYDVLTSLLLRTHSVLIQTGPLDVVHLKVIAKD